MKVLVVDDDPSFLETVRDMLLASKYVVDCVDNAKEGVERVEATKYDYVLVDYKMPENDGIWFMKHARLPRGTKVLLMTGYVKKDAIKALFKLGICGYLIKPLERDELIKHLEFHSPGTQTAESIPAP